MFLNLIKHEYYFLFVIITICFVQLFESTTEVHYNIADPGWLILRINKKKIFSFYIYLFKNVMDHLDYVLKRIKIILAI
jgi:hypothetical protein